MVDQAVDLPGARRAGTHDPAAGAHRRQVRKVTKTRRLLGQKLNRDPSLDEIAAEIGITPERVQDLLELVLDPVSLETPIGDGDSSVADLIPDTSAQQPEVETADRARSSELLDALAKLQPRQRRVVVERFGLDGVRPRTLEEVGANLGITRERVRQLEARALRAPSRRARARAVPAGLIAPAGYVASTDSISRRPASRRSDSSSIWRTRSRVSPSRRPISSRVCGSAPVSP